MQSSKAYSLMSFDKCWLLCDHYVRVEHFFFSRNFSVFRPQEDFKEGSYMVTLRDLQARVWKLLLLLS